MQAVGLLWVNLVYCTAYSIRYLIQRNPVSLNPAYSILTLYRLLSISSLWSLSQGYSMACLLSSLYGLPYAIPYRLSPPLFPSLWSTAVTDTP